MGFYCCSLFAACSNSYPDNGYEYLLYQVECFCTTHPDSALSVLDTINVGVLSKRETAHLCYLKACIKDSKFDFGDTPPLLDTLLGFVSKHQYAATNLPEGESPAIGSVTPSPPTGLRPGRQASSFSKTRTHCLNIPTGEMKHQACVIGLLFLCLIGFFNKNPIKSGIFLFLYHD